MPTVQGTAAGCLTGYWTLEPDRSVRLQYPWGQTKSPKRWETRCSAETMAAARRLRCRLWHLFASASRRVRRPLPPERSRRHRFSKLIFCVICRKGLSGKIAGKSFSYRENEVSYNRFVLLSQWHILILDKSDFATVKMLYWVLLRLCASQPVLFRFPLLYSSEKAAGERPKGHSKAKSHRLQSWRWSNHRPRHLREKQ